MFLKEIFLKQERIHPAGVQIDRNWTYFVKKMDESRLQFRALPFVDEKKQMALFYLFYNAYPPKTKEICQNIHNCKKKVC
jgi:hypothetical protein